MPFSEVIGQKATRQHLVSMVQQNRVSHAMILLGPEGSGGLTIANAFAQYLMCEKVRNAGAPSLFDDEGAAPLPGDSCGQCASCVKSHAFIHPDINYSFPVITSEKIKKPKCSDFIQQWREFMKEKPQGNTYDWLQFIDAENKQGNITAAEVADIHHRMNLKSFENSYKILILWMPEMLGKEGNKLLKLLEEPPPDTLFILVAENENLILPTILSRTQLVKIHPLTRLDIESTLELRHGVAPTKAGQIAAVSNGNFREALIHLGNSEDDWEKLLREWMNSILKTGPVAQLKWVEEIAKTGRENQKQFLRYFSQLIEMALRSAFIPPVSENMSREQDFANRLNKLCRLEQLEAINHELDLAIYHIERNANAKILFHALTIRLYYIISNKTVILVN